ncbi:MAG: flagellar assembly protein FliH [Epsilonproteobacteria bacterium]|nr:flagellar assembly protein FliH [Campylobacterota bacterium]
MATIIANEKLQKHTIDKYNFKVLPLGNGEGKIEGKSEQDVFSKEHHPSRRTEDLSPPVSQSQKDALIESLLKKTDEMSSNFIKLQMKLEAMEEEHKAALEQAKKAAFEEGIEAGKAQAAKSKEAAYENGLNQFSASVASLQKSAEHFEKALESIKGELISAAVDIAKEVINVELAKNSSEVAFKLAEELIKELQNASKITLKVNPKDHGLLSERVGKLENIVILSDSAISIGGVIAMSDAGNIDAQVSKRFERVKRAALNE